MKSITSVSVTLTLIMFYISIMALTTNPNAIYEIETIGFPFEIYRRGEQGGLLVFGLLGNLSLFYGISRLLCLIFEKVKNLGAKRNLRTFP